MQARVVVRTSYIKNFTSSFGRLRQNIVPKSMPHVQHDYFSFFNQSYYWFVTLSLPLLSSFLKLPNEGNNATNQIFDWMNEEK